ncbi:hypothetical protein [Phaeospirillum tilakii]|uniref:Uncharacterized protein n=1 Tax=Phaeospirillum tilakii TaxID=741673 RepID=A0ABW5CD64_9PROT
MARMPAFDRMISVVLTGAREQCQQELVRIVKDELGRVLREDRPTDYDQAIDGVPGRAIEQIDPFGRAYFHFRYGAEVVGFALEALRAVSPVLSGAYRRGHEVFADGALVTDLSQIGDAKTVVITNTLPYARKIEGGRRVKAKDDAPAQRKGSSAQAPDGVYELTAKTVNRRFGNIVKTRFGYVGVDGAEGAKGRGRFPALIIEMQGR